MVPKIPPLPYRKVKRLLARHGFVPIRQKGSHVFFAHPDGRTTVVPVHQYDISPDLVAHILSEAEIPADEVRR